MICGEYAEGKKKEHDDLLEEQEQRHNNMFGDIEKLLTGATSVGLARAFREQKEGYTPRFERTLGFKGFQFNIKTDYNLWAIVFMIGNTCHGLYRCSGFFIFEFRK